MVYLDPTAVATIKTPLQSLPFPVESPVLSSGGFNVKTTAINFRKFSHNHFRPPPPLLVFFSSLLATATSESRLMMKGGGREGTNLIPYKEADAIKLPILLPPLFVHLISLLFNPPKNFLPLSWERERGGEEYKTATLGHHNLAASIFVLSSLPFFLSFLPLRFSPQN